MTCQYVEWNKSARALGYCDCAAESYNVPSGLGIKVLVKYGETFREEPAKTVGLCADHAGILAEMTETVEIKKDANFKFVFRSRAPRVKNNGKTNVKETVATEHSPDYMQWVKSQSSLSFRDWRRR